MDTKIPRIGIDARLYGPEQGGLGRYVQELTAHLEQLDLPAEFFIFLRQENWDSYTPQNPQFKKILANIPWYGWKEQLLLPRIFGRARLNLLHVPHWNVPFFYTGKFVVTIHDLLLLHYGTRRASTLGPITYWFKNQAFRFVLKHAAKTSRHILAPSEFTKNDIIKTLQIPEEKITITPLAPARSPEATVLGGRAGLPAVYRITKPFVLYVGVAFPHKNLDTLVAAWSLVEKKAPGQYQLILAGKRNYFYDRLIQSKNWQALTSARYLDFVPDSELRALYQNASLYIHPSLYEGSALPALEALAYGVPVAASRATCLPEILQTAAEYFNPYNPEEMAAVIFALLQDKTTTKARATKGAAILKGLSWTNVAQKTWEVYKNSV